MNINKEDKMLINQFLDKAFISYNNNYQTNTDFLNLYEQSLFTYHHKDLPPIKYSMIGGHELSERKCIVFYPEYMDDHTYEFPFQILKISPVNVNYSDKLTHRDYLGALLNTGINRNKIGDIIVIKDSAYVFCMRNIIDFIINNIYNIKNTNVKLEIIQYDEALQLTPKYNIINGTVSSMRLDSVVKICLSLSRGKAVELIKASKVYVNSQLIENITYKVNDSTIISIRGYGKFKVCSNNELTKKGRIYIKIYKYI